MRTAIYAGSFDPLTFGHCAVVNQILPLVTNLTIAVGVNPNKKSYFTIEERVDMIKEVLTSNKTDPICLRINVISFANKLLVNLAYEQACDYLVRGIRSSKDFESELELHRINYHLERGRKIITIFVPTPPQFEHISSSTVKGLVGLEDWEAEVSKLVPVQVFNALKRKHERKHDGPEHSEKPAKRVY